MDLPYAFDIKGTTFIGTVHVDEDDLEKTTISGKFVSPGLFLFGEYNLSYDSGEAETENGLVKARIQFDLYNKGLNAQICAKNLMLEWDCPGWTRILSW